VVAYANAAGGSSSYYESGTYGHKYQCVEYVNRFAVQALGLGNMKGTGNAIDYAGSGRKGLHWVQNGSGAYLPDDGDILVIGGGTYGHVAVCTSGGTGGVNMIQQNTGTAKGSLGVKKSGGKYSVKPWYGRSVLGWQSKRKPTAVGSSKESTSEATTKPKPKEDSGTSTTLRHTVRSGETLWAIAERYYGDGSRYTEIAAANHLSNPSLLRVGQRLSIPGKKSKAEAKAEPAKNVVETTTNAPVQTPAKEEPTKAEEGGSKVEESPAPSKEVPAKVEPVQVAMGSFKSLSALSRAVASWFRGRSGEKAKGQLTATLKLLGVAELEVSLDFSGSRSGSAWRVNSTWDLRLSRILFWSLGKKKPGFRVKGLMNIQGKAGEESFRLLSAGLLPQLQGPYPAVATALAEKK
jgi:LysM repeat protein